MWSIKGGVSRGKSVDKLKIVVASDVQWPFINRKADDALNKFLSDFKPDIFVMNGDGIDFPTISDYDRDPQRHSSLTTEITSFKNDYLKVKSSILGPNCTKHYNAGNHEDRLRRYLWRKAPQLTGIVDLETLLDLQVDNWGYTEYHNPINKSGRLGIDIEGLLIVHGYQVRKHSGESARAAYLQFGGSGVVGHTHRIGTYIHRDYRGTYQWLEGGCMCKLEPEYAPAPDWCNGFVAGYIFHHENKPSRFDIHPVPIVHDKFIWEGKIYG